MLPLPFGESSKAIEVTRMIGRNRIGLCTGETARRSLRIPCVGDELRLQLRVAKFKSDGADSDETKIGSERDLDPTWIP